MRLVKDRWVIIFPGTVVFLLEASVIFKNELCKKEVAPNAGFVSQKN